MLAHRQIHHRPAPILSCYHRWQAGFDPGRFSCLEIEVSDILHERGRIAALSRSSPSDDPELVDARRGLALAKIKRLVAEAPPLSLEELQEIATLLKMRVVE
jgi:hypothetical protein